jgi:hypothetical protein
MEVNQTLRTASHGMAQFAGKNWLTDLVRLAHVGTKLAVAATGFSYLEASRVVQGFCRR